MRVKISIAIELVLYLFFVNIVFSKKFEGEKPAWAKKDIRDYSDADLERLYDQWEEDDEPLEPDELPEHLRPSPQIDLTKLDPKNPEKMLQMSKKGKSLMAFVTVSGNPSEQETEKITSLWQSSLMNNHINVDRYPIGENRVIFMFKDGSQAWDAKEFLIEQERLEVVSIENMEYHGKFSSKGNKPNGKKEEL